MVHNYMIFISRNIVRENFKGAPHQHYLFSLSISHNIGTKIFRISTITTFWFSLGHRHLLLLFILLSKIFPAHWPDRILILTFLNIYYNT